MLMLSMLLAGAFAGDAGFQLNDPDKEVQLELVAEAGALAPLYHTLQFSSYGDKLDYIEEGGQDNLFPFVRPTARLHWRRQTFSLIWQPLELNSTVVLDRDLQIDDVLFEAGTPIDMRYGFPFFRLSWGHRVTKGENFDVTIGLGAQIRNATIGFTAVDGSRSETNRDIGLVPLLELELAGRFDSGLFLEYELDGFYAPIRYLNGRGDVDVIGAIIDTQLRAGYQLADPIEAFLGLRWIGGGGSGTGTPDGTGDGYTDNWLHFFVISVGARVR